VTWFGDALAAAAASLGIDPAEVETMVDSAREQAQCIVQATAARVTVAQVEHLVRPGEIDADHIHTPGIFVKRMITCPTGYEKRIEQRTVRKHAPAAAAGASTCSKRRLQGSHLPLERFERERLTGSRGTTSY
jgi:acyl CoA:acetate/3-ketoacid CoA transferase